MGGSRGSAKSATKPTAASSVRRKSSCTKCNFTFIGLPNTSIIDKQSPTISDDPEEHFDDHFSEPAWQLALNHLATHTGKKCTGKVYVQATLPVQKRLCLYRWQGGLGLTVMPVRKK